jgi:hypothetical protein
MSNSKQWFFAIVWIIITIAEFTIFGVTQNTFENLEFVSWMVVANLFFQSLTMVICRLPLTSFFYAFIVFYYLFHFGQIVMMGLFPDYHYDYLNYVEYYMTAHSVLDKTMELCIVSINAFFIGGLLVNPSKIYISSRWVKLGSTQVIRRAFFLLLPFRVLVDGVQITAAMMFGYYGAIKASQMLPGIIASLGNMWYALVPLFYLTLDNKQNKRKFILLILVYLGIAMLTGNRGHQFVCLASLMIVTLATERIRFRTLLKYGIVVIAGLFFIDIIYEMRETSISAFLANPLSFTASTDKSNIILETIGTFGETIYTPYLVVDGCDSVYHTWFGEAFVKSLAGVIPDVFGWLKEINNEAIFPKNLGTQAAIGGSFSGEMYYNFKNWYPLMSAFFGYIYCKLSTIAYQSIKIRKYQEAIMAIAICSLSLWWVRDAIGNLTRQIVWLYWILLLLRPKTAKYIQ